MVRWGVQHLRQRQTEAAQLVLAALLSLLPRPSLDAGVDVIFDDGFESPDPIITSSPVAAGRVDELYSPAAMRGRIRAGA